MAKRRLTGCDMIGNGDWCWNRLLRVLPTHIPYRLGADELWLMRLTLIDIRRRDHAARADGGR